VRYKVVGFKAEGRGKKAEVKCTPLSVRTAIYQTKKKNLTK
jgi:hypothetical protein